MTIPLVVNGRGFRRLRLGKLRAFTIVVLTTVGVASVFADVMVPHNPVEINLAEALRPPFYAEGGNPQYLLGTDRLGRDILSRIIKGSQVSMSVALVGIALSTIIGTALGLYAGYRGGVIETLIMRAADVAFAIPTILLALAFAVAVGPSYWVVVAIMILILWAAFARMARAEAIAIKQREYVALARVAGATTSRILLRHVLPNASTSILTLATLQVGGVIIIEGILSFLGAGIPPPTPSWGGMVADGRSLLQTAPWISLFPGACLFAVVLSFNLLGDWVRDVLDPRLHHT